MPGSSIRYTSSRCAGRRRCSRLVHEAIHRRDTERQPPTALAVAAGASVLGTLSGRDDPMLTASSAVWGMLSPWQSCSRT